MDSKYTIELNPIATMLVTTKIKPDSLAIAPKNWTSVMC
jgi:hypothetical protein